MDSGGIIMSWEQNIRCVEPYIPGEQPGDKNIIKLNTNESPYPPSPKVAEGLMRMDSDAFRLYPAPDCAELVEGLAEYYKVKTNQVFVGVGSDDVLSMAFLTFFQSDKPILFPDITYSFYDVWAKVYGIPYRQCPLDEEFHIRKEDYLTENGGIILPNPNAPTGLLKPVAFIEEIVAGNPDCVVIIDEAYIDFGGESALKLIDKYDNLLVVQTFSKSRAMAGMRIGFAIGSSKLISYLQNTKYAINSYTMNRPALELGVLSLQDEEYFRASVDKIIATRERACKELTKLGFVYPKPAGNFIFASHPAISGKELFIRLKNEGIYIRHWDKPRIDQYVRITIGTDEEMNRLFDCMKKIYKNTEEGNIV